MKNGCCFVLWKQLKHWMSENTVGWMTTKRDVFSAEAAHSSWKNHGGCHIRAGISQDVRFKLVSTKQDFSCLLSELIWSEGIDFRWGRLSLPLMQSFRPTWRVVGLHSMCQNLQDNISVTFYITGIYRPVKVRESLGNNTPRSGTQCLSVLQSFLRFKYRSRLE